MKSLRRCTSGLKESGLSAPIAGTPSCPPVRLIDAIVLNAWNWALPPGTTKVKSEVRPEQRQSGQEILQYSKTLTIALRQIKLGRNPGWLAEIPPSFSKTILSLGRTLPGRRLPLLQPLRLLCVPLLQLLRLLLMLLL
jgi:hypothetical protein